MVKISYKCIYAIQGSLTTTINLYYKLSNTMIIQLLQSEIANL